MVSQGLTIMESVRKGVIQLPDGAVNNGPVPRKDGQLPSA
jgi:hypothetical protein